MIRTGLAIIQVTKMCKIPHSKSVPRILIALASSTSVSTSTTSTSHYLASTASNQTMCGALMLNQDYVSLMPKGGPGVCLFVGDPDDEARLLPIKAHWTMRGCACKFYVYVHM